MNYLKDHSKRFSCKKLFLATFRSSDVHAAEPILEELHFLPWQDLEADARIVTAIVPNFLQPSRPETRNTPFYFRAEVKDGQDFFLIVKRRWLQEYPYITHLPSKMKNNSIFLMNYIMFAN